MIWLFVLHGLVAVAAALVGRRRGRAAFAAAAVAPLLTLVWAAAAARAVLDDGAIEETYGWAGGLGLSAELRLDAFSLLMTALIAGIGVLICSYSMWYFSRRDDLGRMAALLVAFAGSMLGIVLADNLLLTYVFWELTSVTSYLLIGFEDRQANARGAALQAILVTAAGGLAMLAGFVILGEASGTYLLSEILSNPPRGGAVGAALVLVLLGATTKSAQVPFHFWLPAAMAAPTPVSAYLHSATMVKAGVYVIARFAPAFAGIWGPWRPLVVGLGVITMLLGGWSALRQHDLKLLLAHGTVSQLGFMTALVGVGHPELTFAGLALILAHGLFKAPLFMVVGIIDRQVHSRDLRVLNGLGARMPGVLAVAAVAVASMAGLFPTFGFVAKEAAFEALLEPAHGAGTLALVGIAAGSALTAAYGARFIWGGFARKRRDASRADGAGGADVTPPQFAFVAPAAILVVLTMALGVFAGLANQLVVPAARALDAGAQVSPLSLWHGFTAALALSAGTLAAGLAAFAARETVQRAQQRLAVLPRATVLYKGAVAGLVAVADRVTSVMQSGSLPIYLAVIVTTLLAVPGSVLVTSTTLPTDLRVTESLLQGAVAILAAVAAVAATRAARRFVAILLLGGVGFAVAVLFMLQGAPDLALTQLLIETLALVIFVLVLRHLPERFAPVPWRIALVPRLILAAGVGIFVAAFALVAASARIADPVSKAYIERALPQGGGRNVVNVILVDFRALDTLGEVTVLVVAALGIAGLVAAGRREDEQ